MRVHTTTLGRKTDSTADTADIVLSYAAGTGSAAVLAMEEEEPLPQGLFRRRMEEKDFYMEETLFWNAQGPLPAAAAAFLSFAEEEGLFPREEGHPKNS